MPYFSVLLPVCNSQHTILKSLQSIDCQTYGDYSVLVLVNNSNDNSFDICHSFCSSRPNFHLINLHQHFPSLPDVLNFGIRYLRTNCQYIVRHDADDYMLPCRLEHTFQSISSSSQPPMIHCGNAYINDSSTLYFPSSLNPSDYDIKKALLLSSPFIHPAISFKSCTPSLYDTRFVYAQDLKFFIDNMFSGLYSFTSVPYIHYTSSSPSTSKRLKQLSLHDFAINTLHRNLLPGFQFRLSHELRCLYVTEEYRMFSSYTKSALFDIFYKLNSKFTEIYHLSAFS